MTTHSKDSETGRKRTTYLHLVYRIVNGKLETLGLFEKRDAAEKDLALLKGSGWQIADVLCLGWGIIGDLIVGRNADVSE